MNFVYKDGKFTKWGDHNHNHYSHITLDHWIKQTLWRTAPWNIVPIIKSGTADTQMRLAQQQCRMETGLHAHLHNENQLW
jgi:hypothetical protein